MGSNMISRLVVPCPGNQRNIVFVGFPVMSRLKATKKPASLQNRP